MKVADEIKEISPLLSLLKQQIDNDPGDQYFLDLQIKVFNRLNIKVENPPEGYFEQTRIKVTERVKKSKIKSIRPIPSIAASLIILVCAIIFFNNSSQDDILLSEEDLAYFYLENQIEDLTIGELTELAVNDEIDDTFFDDLYNSNIEEIYLEQMDIQDIDETFLTNTLIE